MSSERDMTLTSLQKLIQDTEQLKRHDEDFRRLGPDYRQPVYFTEVLDLVLVLAREIDDVRQAIPTGTGNQP